MGKVLGGRVCSSGEDQVAGDVFVAKTHENSDFVTEINEIYVKLSGNSQRYITESCESESDRKIDVFIYLFIAH
jgi:hypothetical protein